MLCLLLPGVPGGTHLNLLSGKKWPIFAEFVPLVAALSQSLEFESYRRWNCRIGPPIKLVWAWLKVNTLNFFQVQKHSSLSRGPIPSFISCSFTNNTGLALPYNVVDHQLKSFAKIDFRSRTFFGELLCFCFLRNLRFRSRSREVADLRNNGSSTRKKKKEGIH